MRDENGSSAKVAVWTAVITAVATVRDGFVASL